MYLIELVEKHFGIVECKKSDAFTIKNKNEEWQKIGTEFNAISGIHPRHPAVLKNCWENLKKRAKVEQTSRNQHYMGTGGWPPKKDKEDPITDKVLVLIQARVSGYVNPFDSDGTHILASNMTTTCEDIIHTENIECTTDTNICESHLEVKDTEQPSTSTEVITTVQVDWSQYTPRMLQEPTTLALRSSSPKLDVGVWSSCSTHELHTPKRRTSERDPHTHVTASGTSRKRPTLKREFDPKSIVRERINTIIKANTQADEEHEIKMNILRLQEEREQEKIKTKQEALKLQILELQLKQSLE